MRRWCLVFPIAALLSSPASAALRAWLDNDDIAPGDTVQLTLQRDGQTRDQPNLAPLRRDFDVLGTQSSTNIEIINGKTSAGTAVVATLSPKHPGKLTIPGIVWDGEQSAALTLNVAPRAAGNGQHAGTSRSANAKILLESTVDDKQPYVQAAVRVTVRLYAAEPLYQANLDLPATADTLVQQVGSDEPSHIQRDGRDYDVLTRHYVVFPQRSGNMHLAGPVLDARVADRQDRTSPFGTDPFADLFGKSPFGGLLTTTKPIRLHGNPIVLDVSPRPAALANAYWLPARHIDLESQWLPQPLKVRGGDPLTVDLKLEAEGLTAAQLPDLAGLLTLPQGLKEYPDQSKLSNTARGDTIVGRREQSIALIADQPGQFTIPSLRLRWWDTQARQARETTLPEKTLVILPALGTATTRPANPAVPTPSTPARPPAQKTEQAPSLPIHARAPREETALSANGASLWRTIGLGFGLLWLVTLVAWLISHRRIKSSQRVVPETPRSARPDPSSARAAFRDACRNNDAPAARRQLLAWVAAAWPGKAPAGLNELARLSDNPSLSESLRELDRACYGRGPWQGETLAKSLFELPTPKLRTPARDDELAPLYP
jgi:BatD DUF11 like domain